MAWFKVDDKLHDHRKARSAGTAAMGVWLLAGSWAADNLTDGFIPAAILPRWGRPRDAKRLVEVGLWHADEQDGEEGWRFHEWAERQPTRAQKLAEREDRAKAGRIGGKASGRSRREASAKQGASPVVEPPSRPVPSLNTSASADAEREREFDEFWALYPRKRDKGHAVKAYRSARKKADTSAILDGLKRQLPVLEQAEERFRPYAATWLNGERWKDQEDEAAGANDNPWDRFEPPAAPPEVADDPAEYDRWMREKHAEWKAKRAGGEW